MREGTDESENQDEISLARAEFFTIGDLSREFGVTLRTLRFYEDKGLLHPKRNGLTRLYSPADRCRLGLILKGKRFGFTLAEIKAMVAREENDHDGLALSSDKVLQQIVVLEQQRQKIDEAIEELRRTLRTDNGGR